MRLPYLLSILLILMLAFPVSCATYQCIDVTTDQGIVNYKIDNQYSRTSSGLVLPFIGGFGEDSNQTGILGTPNKYYVVSEPCTFITAATDSIGAVSIKFQLPDSGDFNNYIIPVKFTINNTSQQFYVKITQPATNFMNQYKIEVLDSAQTSLINTSVAQLGSGSPGFVSFEGNSVKITHVNTLTNILNIWEAESGSASVAVPYQFCSIIDFDISGYPYACQLNFKDMDGFETTKSYDSVPMAIYWLLNKLIPDNNQNLYYFFKAVDDVWSVSIAIILLCFSMPFAWLMFAGICGLCTCVLRGSISSGLPAGIRTFVNVSLIPVKLLAFILNLLAKLIQAVKPI